MASSPAYSSTGGKARLSLEPLSPPPLSWLKPKQWDPTFRRNSLCEVCFQSITFCPDIDAQCKFCPVVVHITCLSADERKRAFSNNFICAFCVEDLEYSSSKFLERRMNQLSHEKDNKAQTIIATQWRCYRGRKTYTIVMSLIRKLQNAVRARYRVKLLTQYRISVLRPVYITIIRCNELAKGDSTGHADPYVLMTIIDASSPDNQSWSFETHVMNQTRSPIYNCKFMVPGVSGKQILVFTVVDEDDVRHQCLGQATLKMGEPGNAWKTGGMYILPVTKVRFIPKVAGIPLRLDYTSITPTGSIEIQVEPISTVSANCGYMIGPSLNDLERHFKNISPSSGITFFDDNGVPGRGIITVDQFRCNAPSYALSKRVDNMMKRIWVVIVNHNVYLHKRFGEICRFMIELKKSQLELINDGSMKFSLKIESYPEFEFSVLGTADALCWKLSFLTAWKSVRTQEFNFATLLQSIKEHKKMLAAHDGESAVDSVKPRRRSSISMSSLPSSGGLKLHSKKKSHESIR